jgi:DNA-binding PadR family transcriptional regulator
VSLQEFISSCEPFRLVSLIGETKLEILRQLREEPSHGYQLHKDVGVSTPVVYQHLEDLTEAGMVESAPVEGDSRDKTLYHLTGDGRALLELLDDGS